jgi:hypothetical protein
VNTHNDIELFQTGEPPEDSKNCIQLRNTGTDGQNLYGAHRVFQADWAQSLKKKKTINMKT